MTLVPGLVYSLTVAMPASGLDPLLELYDTDGVTLLLADSTSDFGTNQLRFTPLSNAPHYLRVMAEEFSNANNCDQSATYAVTVTYSRSPPPPPLTNVEPPTLPAPALDSTVLTPTNGMLLTSLDPITATGGAFANQGLQQLDVTLNPFVIGHR